MIDVVMLSCNRARITEITITELVRRTKLPFRLTVLDNGSTDESPKTLARLHSEGLVDQYIVSNENTGVHRGFNHLLARVTSKPYHVCTDNDLVPAIPDREGDWLYKLIALMEDYPEYGAIACRSQMLVGEHGDFFDGASEVRETDYIRAHLRIMRTSLVEELGGWKQMKVPDRNDRNDQNGEGRFICDEMRGAGYKVGYARDVYCIHLTGEKNQGEDPWGYPGRMTPQDHGHCETWPPPDHFSWQRLGLDWETCCLVE